MQVRQQLAVKTFIGTDLVRIEKIDEIKQAQPLVAVEDRISRFPKEQVAPGKYAQADRKFERHEIIEESHVAALIQVKLKKSHAISPDAPGLARSLSHGRASARILYYLRRPDRWWGGADAGNLFDPALCAVCRADIFTYADFLG